VSQQQNPPDKIQYWYHGPWPGLVSRYVSQGQVYNYIGYLVYIYILGTGIYNIYILGIYTVVIDNENQGENAWLQYIKKKKKKKINKLKAKTCPNPSISIGLSSCFSCFSAEPSPLK
jgi:hypothetical protein